MVEILPPWILGVLSLEPMVVLEAVAAAALLMRIRLVAMAVPMVPMVLKALVLAVKAKVPLPANLVKQVPHYMPVAAVEVRIIRIQQAQEARAVEALALITEVLLHLVLQTLAAVVAVSVTPKTMARAAAASLSSARPRIKEVPQ